MKKLCFLLIAILFTSCSPSHKVTNSRKNLSYSKTEKAPLKYNILQRSREQLSYEVPKKSKYVKKR